MKLEHFFYPYPVSSGCRRAGDGRRPRTVSGLAVDPRTGHLLIVDPGPGEGWGIYELTTDGRCVAQPVLPRPGGLRPYGIAAAAASGRFWVTDSESACAARIDRTGDVVRRLQTRPIGISRPGVLTAGREASSLFIADRDRNFVVRLGAGGIRLSAFELTPFAGARLRGITCDHRSGNLLLAYAPRWPERAGRIGESGIFKTTPRGRVIGRLDTADLGFCALDIALMPESRQLYASSREYVLPQTIGDHSHIFALDLDRSIESGPEPNPEIVRHFLLYNNLHPNHQVDRHLYELCRWQRQPVPVFITELIDMAESEAQDIFTEWAIHAQGNLRFRFVDKPGKRGIVFTQGEVALAAGRPGRHDVVTVCVCDHSHLPCHPRCMDANSVMRNVARHEIGHAIGFRGHSPRFQVDTMNSISGFSEKISSEEAAFIKILYSLPRHPSAGEITEAIHRECLQGDHDGRQD